MENLLLPHKKHELTPESRKFPNRANWFTRTDILYSVRFLSRCLGNRSILAESLSLDCYSQRQLKVFSATETEYCTACEDVEDIKWLKRLWSRLSNKYILCELSKNKQSAIKIIKNPDILTKPLSKHCFDYLNNVRETLLCQHLK